MGCDAGLKFHQKGGGISGTISTDNTIQGTGTVPDPLRLHGIINGIIDELLVVQSGERMINSRIDITAGGMIDIQPGGYVELII